MRQTGLFAFPFAALLFIQASTAQPGQYAACGEGGPDVDVERWVDGRFPTGNQPELEQANCVTPPGDEHARQDPTAALTQGGAYAWRQFLYLASKGDDQRYRLMRFGDSESLMPLTGEPPAFEEASRRGLTGGPTGKHGGVHGVQQAASMVPYVDQYGRWLHYSVAVNGDEWRYVAGRSESNRLPLYTSAGYNKKMCAALLNERKAPSAGDDPTTLDPAAVAYVDCVSGMRCLASDFKASGCITVPAENLPVTLPVTSIELKASWRVLETCNLPDSPPNDCVVEDGSEYVTIETSVDPYGPGDLFKEQHVTLGLVGLHILSKTDKQPDWVWATFEHNKNAPDCDTDKPAPPLNMFCLPEPLPLSAWAGQPLDPFTAPAGPLTPEDSLEEHARNDPTNTVNEGTDELLCVGQPNVYINARPRLYEPKRDDHRRAKLNPTAVCRLNRIDAAVRTVNEQIHAKLTSGLNLRNYHLVGVFWFDRNCREDPKCRTLGTQTLSNTTAETYLQKLTCTVCHGMNQSNPAPFNSKYIAAGIADRSFIFQRIRQPGDASSDSN